MVQKEKEKKKYKKDKYKNKKKYYLKKSSARKSYLNKDRHVRKYNPRRNYNNKLACFTCGSTDHLSQECNHKNNLHNKNLILVECVNNNILEVDKYMDGNESIYIIVSI